MLAVGASERGVDIVFLPSMFFFLSPSLEDDPI